MTGYTWFGSGQPVVRRVRDDETAVRQMRRAIEEYERSRLGS